MRKSIFGRELNLEECRAVSGGSSDSDTSSTSSTSTTEEETGGDPSRGGKIVLAGG